MSAPESYVNARYGAPMGRPCRPLVGEVRLRQVRLDAGGYDKGGAYWGHHRRLYYARSDHGGCLYFRADDRAHACRLLVTRFGVHTALIHGYPAKVRFVSK